MVTASLADTPSPWISIWFKPRYSIRRILDSGNFGPYMLLAAVGGIDLVLYKLSEKTYADLPISTALGMAIIIGPIGGLISIYLWGWLLPWSGRWLKGTATAREMRVALGWAQVPAIVSLFFWGVDLTVHGDHAFSNSVEPTTLSIVLGLLSTILILWQFFIHIKLIAEVQKFSAIRAIGNVILSWLVVVVPTAIIAITALVAVSILGRQVASG
jgi:hypothetical protein